MSGRGACGLVVVFLLLAALTACGRDSTPFTPREVPAAVAIDPANPCPRQADLSAELAAQQAAAQAAGQTQAEAPATPVAARYDRAAGTVTVTAGTGFGPAALAAAVRDPAVLREVSPGNWLLGANLVLSAGTAMRIAAPQVRWFGLASGPGRYVTLSVLGGRLDIAGSCVTSWDAAAGRADTDHLDGRAYVLARDAAQLYVDHAEVRFLGYGAVESYGLSLRTTGTTGAITRSVVSHLYFGVYTYEVDGFRVADSEFHDNVVYGIDPHTGSRNMVIERNVVHDNGKHGIILAEDCVDSVIRGNVVYRNAHHGIVLYQRSDRNVVEGNETFLNVAQGINLNESNRNVVRDNRVYHNGESGIGVGQTSTANVVEHNVVLANGQDGVRLVSEATDSTVRANSLGNNARYGIYVDTQGPFEIRGNSIYGSRVGVLFKSDGTEPEEPEGNDLFDNRDGDVVAR
ncbi:MAG: right-handed parallel beta-helix repeat-containing protein [Pseudonocardia sp.]